MSTALAYVSESLYQVEDDLNALLNSVDLCETDEQREEIRNEIALAVNRSVAKRDQVAAWLAREESTIAAIDAEIERLDALKKKRCRAIERVEECVISVILRLEPDKKGRFAKLAGTTSEFAVKKNPPSIEIADASLIPDRFESVSLQFSPEEWEAFTGDLDLDTYSKLTDFIKNRCASKSAIRKALDTGEIVPGAQYAPVKYRLERG